MKRSSIDHALSIAKHSKPLPPLVIRKARKADGGGVDDGTRPPFDPSKPFKALDNGPPPFEATQPIAWDRTKPPFDPSKPFRPLTDEEVGLGKIKWDDPDVADAPWLDYKRVTDPAILAQLNKDKSSSGSLSSLALQVPTGFNEALATGVGAPVDAMTWALNQIPGVKIKDPLMGSEFIKKGMGLIGANPDNAPATTPAERIARGTGSGVAAMVAPEVALGAAGELGIAPAATNALRGAFGASETLPAAVGNAAVGGLSGAGGSAASEVVPERYKPIAELGGNLAGGGLGTAGVAAARGAGWLLKGARDYLAPLTEGGQQQAAAKTLASRATSAAGLRDALENPPAELVPGSKPTTFQQTGDMGLGSLEREVAAQNPAEFMQRRADQNAARVDALGDLQRTGSPADVSNAVRQQLQSIDQMTSDAVARATEAATGSTEALGGHGTSEGYGATLRDYAAQARATAKQQERSLWKAVDPDNTLALPAMPLKDAADNIEKSVTPSAKPIAGEERAVLDTIGQYRGVMPFSEVTDLRSRVSTAMREELRASGETPVYARLSRLRSAIENTISGAVEYKAAQEAHAVARGELSPEQTVAAAIRRQIDEWRSAKAEATGTGDPAGATASVAGRTFTVPGAGGAARPSGRGSATAPGDQGIPRDVPLEPNFDQAARERLNAATTATRQRVDTFDKGTVGAVLRPGGMKGQYRAADSAVPAQIFKRGPSGFEAINSYRNAVGDTQAMGVLGDYAAASLRQAAAKPDGTIDPARFNTWRKAHADALRALPELAGRFEDAATASRAIEDLAAIRREALEHYQRGAFGQLANANSPEDVTRIIGSLFGQRDSAKTMRSLVAETRNNSAAREGLRKAVVDHIQNKFISNAEAGSSELGTIKSDQFQNFVRNNSPVLRQIFSEPEINSLGAIAADLQRSNRSIAAVKLPGGSNTAQDQAARQLSLLSKIIHHGRDAAAGAAVGMGAAGPFGALLGTVGGSVVTAMRDAGMKRVDDLIRDALLNPELARKLLAKGLESGSKSRQIAIAQYLRRNSAAALFDAHTDNTEKKQ